MQAPCRRCPQGSIRRSRSRGSRQTQQASSAPSLAAGATGTVHLWTSSRARRSSFAGFSLARLPSARRSSMRPGRACASAATTARAAARRATAATTSKSGMSSRGPGRASLPPPCNEGGRGRGSRMRPREPVLLPPPAPPTPPAESPAAAALAGRPAPACRSRTCAESCRSMRRLCRCASDIPSSSACRLSSEAPRPARDVRRARAWKCGLSGRHLTVGSGRAPAHSSPRSRASMLSCSSFTCGSRKQIHRRNGVQSRQAGAGGEGDGRGVAAHWNSSRDRWDGCLPGPGASPGGRVPNRAFLLPPVQQPLTSPHNPARGAPTPPSARPPPPPRPARPRQVPPHPWAPPAPPARRARSCPAPTPAGARTAGTPPSTDLPRLPRRWPRPRAGLLERGLRASRAEGGRGEGGGSKMGAAGARVTAASPLRAWQLPAPRPPPRPRACPWRRSGCRAGPRQGPAPRARSARQRG